MLVITATSGGNLGQIVDLPEVIHPHLQHTDWCWVVRRNRVREDPARCLKFPSVFKTRTSAQIPSTMSLWCFAYAASDADDGMGNFSLTPCHLPWPAWCPPPGYRTFQQQHLGTSSVRQRRRRSPAHWHIPCPSVRSPAGPQKVSLVDSPLVCLHAVMVLSATALSQEPSAGGGQNSLTVIGPLRVLFFCWSSALPHPERLSMIRWHRLALVNATAAASWAPAGGGHPGRC